MSDAPRYLGGYGLVELRLDDCVERLGDVDNGRAQVSLANSDASREEAIAYLSHLTHPATRHALFAVNERWTAMLSNLRDGSDFADDQPWVTQCTRARTCRVVDSSDPFPARVFELVGAEGRTVRAVSCVLDGDRWDFYVSGQALPAEASFDHTARRKRDRFTSENLQTLLAALSVKPPVREAFAATDRFILLDARLKNQEWALEVEANACTPEQADDPGYGYFQRGRNWLAHIETHATSLVWDMTRAVLLNPALESDAQPYLDAARKRLGTAEVERLSREAADDLWRRGD